MVGLLLAVIYICFISLGLPDSLLGSAWPTIYQQMNIPVSYAGIVSILISCGTITSSIFSDKLTRKLGAGPVIFLSFALIAVGLFGFYKSTHFWNLMAFAIPYGLGAGAVDAALNNYVALHFKSRHMSWLHCMWGVGATISPYIMGYALTNGKGWNKGYLYVFIIQIAICIMSFISLPLWRNKTLKTVDNKPDRAKTISFKELFSIKGAIASFICFFCYCALEQTSMLWGSTYFNSYVGLDKDIAANLGSLFLIGLTVGRFINGFLTLKFSPKTLIRFGGLLIIVGCILMPLPLNKWITFCAFIIVGLGCAPIYPSIIVLTPKTFGENRSQAIIGMQMAFAYIGNLLMPSLFGLIAKNLSVGWLPLYVGLFAILMITMHEILIKKQAINL